MAGLLFDHVIVLMLENRSFDHIFGYLGIGAGLTKRGAVNYLTPGNARTPAFRTRRGGDFVAVGEGPPHSLKEVNEQLYGTTKPLRGVSAASAKMNGFVGSFRNSLAYELRRAPTDSELQQVMNCFDPDQLPVLSALARNFVLCDRWFADVPGPTMPNRAFVHAATSQGYTYNADWKPRFECETLYHRLDAKPGCSWRVYYFDQNDVLELYPYLKSNAANHVLFEDGFLKDVSEGNLTTYSFIVPAFIGKNHATVNSMHAPADVRPAEKLVADIYGALQANETVWRKTLFILLFDEHGGYFDHIVPPATVSPDGIPGRMDKTFLVPFDFKRLGLRVPAILISPWFPAAVDSTVYSHSSIPGSIIEAFQLPGGFLTARDHTAAKLTGRYMMSDPGRKWRTNVPTLTIPVQPKPLDSIQREILGGSVYLDPHPEARSTLRTRDILDRRQATDFMRTQIAKHLEHRWASGGRQRVAATLRAERQLPSTSVSPARINELKGTISPSARPARTGRAGRRRRGLEGGKD